jgi:predicted transposase YdaD
MLDKMPFCGALNQQPARPGGSSVASEIAGCTGFCTPKRLATTTLARITEITQDKEMVDAREKAIRDQQWALNAAHREGEIKGKIEGKIELIRTLEGILGLALSNVEDLQKLDLEALQMRTSNLQDRARDRA